MHIYLMKMHVLEECTCDVHWQMDGKEETVLNFALQKENLDSEDIVGEDSVETLIEGQ